MPRLAARLRSFLFRFEAPHQLADARTALEVHAAAQRELGASPLFAAVLERVLAVRREQGVVGSWAGRDCALVPGRAGWGGWVGGCSWNITCLPLLGVARQLKACGRHE